MLRTALRTGTAVGILATALAMDFGQAERRPDQKSPAQQALRAKSILGSTVHLQGNAAGGMIEDIVFDDEGVIDYFVVSQNGKLVTVPWEAAKFNFQNRTATINITPEQYGKIPTYTNERYPEFYSPGYETEIYGYYNLRPGQVRRLDRRTKR